MIKVFNLVDRQVDIAYCRFLVSRFHPPISQRSFICNLVAASRRARNFNSLFSSGAMIRLDLPGVKYYTRNLRPETGKDWTIHRPQAPSLGTLWRLGWDADQGRGAAQGAEPNGGGMLVLDQAIWNRSDGRAGERGG